MDGSVDSVSGPMVEHSPFFLLPEESVEASCSLLLFCFSNSSKLIAIHPSSVSASISEDEVLYAARVESLSLGSFIFLQDLIATRKAFARTIKTSICFSKSL